MRRWMLLLTLFITACSSAQDGTAGTGNYPDLGAAPELEGDVWLNTEAPLRLADLRGRVVLLEMWTFG